MIICCCNNYSEDELVEVIRNSENFYEEFRSEEARCGMCLQEIERLQNQISSSGSSS